MVGQWFYTLGCLVDPHRSIWLDNVILERSKNHCDIGQGMFVHIEADVKPLFSYSMVLLEQEGTVGTPSLHWHWGSIP